MWLLKLAVAMFSLFFIYREVMQKEHFGDFISFCKNANTPFVILLVAIVFFLMILNWMIEAQKWKYLIQFEEPVSFARAFRGVLTGTAISFFTPNRVGEFAGRILVLKPEHRIRGALATLVGSVSQLLVTILTGLLALPFVLPLIKKIVLLDYAFVFVSVILISFVLVKLYFTIYLLSPIHLRFLYKFDIAKFTLLFA